MALDNIEVKEKAEFNMAVSYLNRLNALLYACDEASIRLDIYSWFHVLATLYRELSTEVTEEQDKVLDDEIFKMNNIVAKIMQDNKRTGRLLIPQQDYIVFHKFTKKMIRIMKDAGLLMRMQSDASKALFES